MYSLHLCHCKVLKIVSSSALPTSLYGTCYAKITCYVCQLGLESPVMLGSMQKSTKMIQFKKAYNTNQLQFSQMTMGSIGKVKLSPNKLSN